MSETTHDLRRCTWGHSIDFLRRNLDGSWHVCIFLSARLKDGDHVLVQGKTSELRYVVRGEVDCPIDPGDQHFATLVYDPVLTP